jgi:crotonobetainyl-CoA:carnitine CoA-transferase CaiB-like acyl-CoA transferase
VTDTQSNSPGTPEPAGLLDGVKVLDLTRVASGPFATQLLADLGATVIKVERPDRGDDSRHMDASGVPGISGYYLGLNRGKRSYTLDFKTEQGARKIRALTRWADIVIENFRPGVAERLGAGYEDLRTINPRIIYCSISAFGTDGPLKDNLGYDIVAQAMSGIMAITGDADRPPAKCGAPIADVSAGAMAAIGILAALYKRALTGEGQRVETTLIGSAIALLAPYLGGQTLGTKFGRHGSRHNTIAPYQAFSGSDGHYFVVAVGNESFWGKLCAAIGSPELAVDPEFATNNLRMAHVDELEDRLQQIFGHRPAREWYELLTKHGVPASLILDLDEVIAEEHFSSLGVVNDVDCRELGQVPLTGTPLKFSGYPVGSHLPPPRLGEHNSEVDMLIESYDDDGDPAARR